ITRFDASRLSSQIAGEVKEFDVAPYLSSKEARRMDLFIHYGMAAGLQAWRDAGVQVTPENGERVGVNFGSGIGGIPLIEAVLEEYERARARGARIYCELAGYGVSADAFHMTAPSEDGDGAFRCMRNALKDANLETSAVDYINAHGTSTPLGDVAETRAVKRLLGARAGKVAVNSTKSMTGHLLGAAGGVEAVFSALALRDQVSPPT